MCRENYLRGNRFEVLLQQSRGVALIQNSSGDSGGEPRKRRGYLAEEEEEEFVVLLRFQEKDAGKEGGQRG